jgi:hypothetical protein
MNYLLRFLFYPIFTSFFLAPSLANAQSWSNTAVPYDPAYNASAYSRHEHGSAYFGFGGHDLCAVIGGRSGSNPDRRRVILYDRKQNYLEMGAECPVELHHFQAVVWRDSLVVCGMGMKGGYPGEDPHTEIYLYNAAADAWSIATTVPAGRERGSAQAIVDGDWVYFFNGITDGHKSGWSNFCDRYNLATGVWEVLPSSPRARDHAIALQEGNLVYIVGGRESNASGAKGSGWLHSFPVLPIDVFDLTTQSWSTLPATADLPEARAGLLGVIQTNEAGQRQLNLWGGEHGGGTRATGTGLNLQTLQWTALPSLATTLHGAQIAVVTPDTLVTLTGAISGGNEIEPTSNLYAQTYNTAPLPTFPVTWLDLRGTVQPAGAVTLHWEVKEQQVAYFEILRSAAPTQSPSMVRERLEAKGDGRQQYTFLDYFPASTQTLHYQIRSVDYDGSTDLSEVLSLHHEAFSLGVYPTTLRGSQPQLHFKGGHPHHLTLINIHGQVAWRGELNQDTWKVPATLAPGSYTVRVTFTDNRTFSTRVVRE